MRDLDKLLEHMPESLQFFYRKHIGQVKQGIADYFPDHIDDAFVRRFSGQATLFERDLDRLYESIFLPTQEYLTRGGKVLRPILVALCLEAYGFDPSRSNHLLGAIEVMEDSSIMMDDYIDNSLLRRGGPCAHIAHGFPVANISSCTAFALCHYLFYNNELQFPAEKARRLLDAFAREHLQMAYGQTIELFWTENNVNTVTETLYLQETIARCAFLSFRGPMVYAGIVADAPEEDLATLAKIGDYFLIGYHIKGDDLDIRPDSDAWGKIAGEDITTGRRTLLFNYVLEQANEEDRQTMVEILNSRTRDESLKRQVYELVLKYKGFEYTRQLAARFNTRAIQEIERLHISDAHKSLFYEFSEFACRKRAL